MAHRRCLGALVRHCRPLLSPSIQRTLTLEIATPTSSRSPLSPAQWIHLLRSDHPRNLSSRRKNSDDDDDHYQYQLSGGEDDDDDDDGDDDEEEEIEDGGAPGMRRAVQSGKTEEEKLKEAAEIGYVVAGALERSEKPFKLWEPVYAVVQLGSHQFKVSNGDSIFTERLKYCDVNDKLILNKVLMLGSRTQTIIGRPILPDAAVQAVVEEHALDAKVIIFKKKRRKNYRRTRGHRQELTKLRITDIQGIDKTEVTAVAA